MIHFQELIKCKLIFFCRWSSANIHPHWNKRARHTNKWTSIVIIMSLGNNFSLLFCYNDSFEHKYILIWQHRIVSLFLVIDARKLCVASRDTHSHISITIERSSLNKNKSVIILLYSSNKKKMPLDQRHWNTKKRKKIEPFFFRKKKLLLYKKQKKKIWNFFFVFPKSNSRKEPSWTPPDRECCLGRPGHSTRYY